MALSHKARRNWSLVLLLIWLPIYIIIAIVILAMIGPMPIWASVPVYAILGVAWAFPFKFVFVGIGKPDPDADDADS